MTDTTKTPQPTSQSKRLHRRRRPELPKKIRDEIVNLKEQGYGKRQISARVGHPSRVIAEVLREEGLLQKGLGTSRILREIRALGYQGGRTILAVFAGRLRSELTLEPIKPIKRRFETGPGEELQIDFSPYLVPVGDRQVHVHAFAALLCYSRRLYLRLFREERTSTVLEGLAGAFEYNKGVTLRVVMDNMTQAVLGRVGKDREVLWQPRLLDCARHYGFEPVACAVRDPDRKGKDEKVFRLVYDDFLKGSEFESWEDLERRCRIWLDQTPGAGNLRVHGTTRKVPNEAWEKEEQPFLIRLPGERFAAHEPSIREVDRDSTLSIRGVRYSVPTTLAGRSVAVRLFADHFEVLDRQGRIAFSRRYAPDSQKGTLIIDKSHYDLLPRRPKGQSPGRLDETFAKRFPDLTSLVDGLKRRYKTLAPIQLRALLRLADRYGQDAFIAAAKHAQEYRRFDAGAVERILEREHPLTPEADAQAPLGGAGPAVVGEVELPSLDRYGQLDAAKASPQTPDSASNATPACVGDKKDDEGGDHGA